MSLKPRHNKDDLIIEELSSCFPSLPQG